MPANTVPIFPITPRVDGGKIRDADTDLENPVTNSVPVFTAGPYGSRIDMIRICALGIESDASGGYVNLFVYDGDSYMFVHAYPLPITPTDPAVIAYNNGYESIPVVPFLPADYSIVATTNATGTTGWMVTVFGGDY